MDTSIDWTGGKEWLDSLPQNRYDTLLISIITSNARIISKALIGDLTPELGEPLNIDDITTAYLLSGKKVPGNYTQGNNAHGSPDRLYVRITDTELVIGFQGVCPLNPEEVPRNGARIAGLKAADNLAEYVTRITGRVIRRNREHISEVKSHHGNSQSLWF